MRECCGGERLRHTRNDICRVILRVDDPRGINQLYYSGSSLRFEINQDITDFSMCQEMHRKALKVLLYDVLQMGARRHFYLILSLELGDEMTVTVGNKHGFKTNLLTSEQDNNSGMRSA